VGERLRFFRARAEEAAPFAERGFIITDPPYGKRLGTPEEADALYASLNAFADRFARWELCFVVDREEFGSFAGDRAPAERGDRAGMHGRYGRGAAPSGSAWKKTKIVDGAETRWLHRSIARSAPSSR